MNNNNHKLKICFVCTGNACRSQMAEGLANKIADSKIEVYSAGSHPAGYIPDKTVQVMKEIGIDITSQSSKSIQDVPLQEMNYVITLCDDATAYCPSVLAKGIKLHWPFPDPTRVLGKEDRVLGAYRQIRDALAKKLELWIPTVIS